jgi:hypothetical protein
MIGIPGKCNEHLLVITVYKMWASVHHDVSKRAVIALFQNPTPGAVLKGRGRSLIVLIVVLIVGPKLSIEPGTKAFFELSSVSDHWADQNHDVVLRSASEPTKVASVLFMSDEKLSVKPEDFVSTVWERFSTVGFSLRPCPAMERREEPRRILEKR